MIPADDRCQRLDDLLVQTLYRRQTRRAMRRSLRSPLDVVVVRLETARGVLAWARRTSACSIATSAVGPDALFPQLEQLYAWCVALAFEILTIESVAVD